MVATPDDGSEDETVMVATPDDGSIDIEVPAEEPSDSSIDIEVPAEELSDSSIENDDFEIDLSIGESDTANKSDSDTETLEALEKTEFDLDIDDLETIHDSTSSEQKDNTSDDEEIDLDLDFDIDSSVTDDIVKEDTHAAFVEKVAESEELSTEDVVATKLDLAIAYVEVSDKENATIILNEVLEEGDEEQRKQAKKLLDQI